LLRLGARSCAGESVVVCSRLAGEVQVRAGGLLQFGWVATFSCGAVPMSVRVGRKGAAG
jgi:hypothetical protein